MADPTPNPKPPARPAQKPPEKLPAKSFLPDLERRRSAVETRRWYWIGAIPSLPTESVDLAGLNFPKVNELVAKDRDGNTQRMPVVGSLVQLSREDVERLRLKAARTVVRFRAPKKKVKIEDPRLHRGRPERKGQLITIATDEELNQRRASGIIPVPYVQSPYDEPVANYVFAYLCPDQRSPERLNHYPPPLSETGLDWVDQLPDAGEEPEDAADVA